VLGHVAAIFEQDGQWFVQTSHGWITGRSELRADPSTISTTREKSS